MHQVRVFGEYLDVTKSPPPTPVQRLPPAPPPPPALFDPPAAGPLPPGACLPCSLDLDSFVIPTGKLGDFFRSWLPSGATPLTTLVGTILAPGVTVKADLSRVLTDALCTFASSGADLRGGGSRPFTRFANAPGDIGAGVGDDSALWDMVRAHVCVCVCVCGGVRWW